MENARLLMLSAVLALAGCGENKITCANNLHEIGLAIPGDRAPVGSEPPLYGPPAQAKLKNEETDNGPVSRKIKYTADIQLIVNDFDKAQRELLAVVKDQQSYLAQSDINGSSGAPRSGRWTVRVPVDRFHAFLEAAAKLGVPQRNSTDSQDVTAEYVDLEARLKNKRETEETLRGYLKDKKAGSALKDILTVEQELARVRGEIEQLEGQLRLLTNLTSLTTVTVQIQEIKNYVPPQAPTFGSTIGTTFQNSFELLVRFAKTVVLTCVAVVPWLPLLALCGGLLWLVARRRWRRAIL